MADGNKYADMKARIVASVKSIKGISWLVVFGVCGMLLVGVSSLFDGRAQTQETSADDDIEVYAAALEERLEHMVASIDGAGKTRVMVTLENGIEYVYADEETVNSDRREQNGNVEVSDDNQRKIVTIDAVNGKEGLLITEIQPTIRGVVVACEGARQAEVSTMVIEAVKTALDISDKRVCVIPYADEGVS